MSDTVAEMRAMAGLHERLQWWKTSNADISRWADELEAAQHEIFNLKAQLAAAEQRCEDYRDASVVWKAQLTTVERRCEESEGMADHLRNCLLNTEQKLADSQLAVAPKVVRDDAIKAAVKALWERMY